VYILREEKGAVTVVYQPFFPGQNHLENQQRKDHHPRENHHPKEDGHNKSLKWDEESVLIVCDSSVPVTSVPDRSIPVRSVPTFNVASLCAPVRNMATTSVSSAPVRSVTICFQRTSEKCGYECFQCPSEKGGY